VVWILQTAIITSTATFINLSVSATILTRMYYLTASFTYLRYVYQVSPVSPHVILCTTYIHTYIHMYAPNTFSRQKILPRLENRFN
jgi:hypothetical protein